MRIAVVCDTAYQIMNALNIIYHQRQRGSDEVDLYIGHQFVNSYEVARRLAAEGLFDNIYGYRTKGKASSIGEKLNRVIDILFPARSLKRQLLEKVDLSNKNYDQILASMATHFSVSLIFAFPNAEVNYFDDGIGSYVHELSISMFSPFNRKLYKLLGKDLQKIVPNKIYLNNPDFANDVIKVKVRPLPVLSAAPQQLWDIYRRVWDYTDDGYYREHKFICLTQPGNGDERVDMIYDIIMTQLQRTTSDCMIRPHPRQKDVDNRGFEVDSHREMWELVCADQITEDHVIVADFSTAQIVPKMLFDVEPYLIFAYKITLDYLSEESKTEFQSLIARVKEKYRDPKKVFVVETAEELAEVLTRFRATVN